MPWLIKYLNAPLMLSSYIVFTACAIVMVMNIKKIDMKHLIIDRQEMALVGIFLIVLILRCAPMLFQIAPSGADMSVYSNVARLIYENDGISYSNKMPIAGPISNATGFAVLSAETSLLGDIPAFRGALLLSCISYATACFGLYVLLLKFFDGTTAAAAAIASSFLLCSPWWLLRLGGCPALLSLFFFLIAITLIIELKCDFSMSLFVTGHMEIELKR